MEDKRLSRGHHTLLALRRSLAELTVDRPLRNITIDEICARCGLTKGAFYHHFSSKDELLGQYAISDMSLFMASAISQAEQDYPNAPDKQIFQWIISLVQYIDTHRVSFKGYLFIGYSGNVLSEFVTDWHDAAFSRLHEWQQCGQLRSDLSVQALHHYLDTFTYGMAALCMNEYYPSPPDQRLIMDFIRTLLPA